MPPSSTHNVSESETIPEIVLEPRSGWAALDLLELWRHRELAYYLAWRDVKVRYKQTILGASWAVLQPLMKTMMFTFLSHVMQRQAEPTELPYPLVTFASLLAWQFFEYSVSTGGQSLIASANLISKVYFPRLLVPLSTIGVGLIDMAVGSVVLALMMLFYHVAPPLAVLFLPGLLIGLLLASVGVASLVSALAVTYRDVRFVIPFIVQIWMFACPTLYSIDRIPERWRPLYSVNPMAGIIGGFRACILGETLDPLSLSISLASSVIVFVVGITYFRRVEKRFADIV
jgi:lipopolysaccharide transport system permease protein